MIVPSPFDGTPANADVKIFVTAAPEIRARRRTLELEAGGQTVNEAEILAEPKAADAALEAAQAFVRDNVVVNPYLFDVRTVGGAVQPVKEREIIRAAGPSVRTDTGKQANASRSDRHV